jgi:hypothetical protein
MIRSRLQLRNDAKIGCEEDRSQFRDQLFSGALAAIFGISGQVAIEPVRGACPMGIMPISA